MSLQTKTSFAGGELDPALRRRVTLEKYNSGIAKGRNCIIGKTGRIINTPGTTFHLETKVPTAEVKTSTTSPTLKSYFLDSLRYPLKFFILNDSFFF